MAPANVSKKFFLGVRWELWICLFMVGGLLVVYAQVTQFEFIHYDDSLYVFDNRYVQSGLTLDGLAWAFQFKDRDFLTYWHPLTWLSHMLDSHLFGLNPGWHHITNLCFHAFNSLLLFGVFNRMTGALWQSAFVAALFAVHPLNIESVAWVAERKNVLSTTFWMLTLLSYFHYVARPVMSRYLLTVLIFMLGLMAKPMLVTLPFVLLLLDYWPLKRFESRPLEDSIGNRPGKSGKTGIGYNIVVRAVLEKIPFLLFSAAAVYLSSSAVKSFKMMVSLELVPMKLRFSNALVTYVKYMLKMIWPLNLSIFYPYPKSIPVLQMVGALIILAGISFGVVRMARSRPYLGVGWLWYLGTLVPVSGFVQAGLWPEMADRWAYIPLIGIFIMIAWGVPDALPKWRYKQNSLVIVSITIIMLLMALARLQAGYWQNSIGLFERSLAVTDRNPLLHNNLGVALENKGETDEAIRHYRAALQVDPVHVEAHINLGNALSQLGQDTEAIRHYRKVLKISPQYSKAHFNLGNIFLRQGRLKEAASRYLAALKINPFFAEAHNNLGSALVLQGRTAASLSHFREALRIRPDYQDARNNLNENLSALKEKQTAILKMEKMLKEAPKDFRLHFNLARLYKSNGELGRALKHYQEALSIEPGLVEASNEMGIIYARQGEYRRARKFFKASIAKRPDVPSAYYFLAGSYARQNRTEEALDWLQRAIDRGFNNWDLIKADRNFESIRGTAYYQSLIKNR